MIGQVAGLRGKAVDGHDGRDEDAARLVFVAQPLPALTKYTITDHNVLRDELKRVRSRGYSIDTQEVVVAVWCLGVPILDRSGSAVGAISISGPKLKKPGPAARALADQLEQVCTLLSRHLGYEADSTR